MLACISLSLFINSLLARLAVLAVAVELYTAMIMCHVALCLPNAHLGQATMCFHMHRDHVDLGESGVFVWRV